MAENRRPSQRYLSGRVKLSKNAGLGTDRHLYLSPSDAEPNLGFPGEKGIPVSGTYYKLITIPNGTAYDRYWQVDSPATLVNGISIFDEGTLVGTANTVSKINFVGSAITATASGTISTVSVSPPGTDKQVLFNDLDDFGAASQLFYDKSSNRIGIGVSNPTQQLHLNGDFRITGKIWDQHNQVGGASSVLIATGTGVSWSSSAGANVQISPNAPSNAISGDLWWDSEDGDLNVYYEDADSSAWVSANANADQEDGRWTLDAIGIHTISNVGIGTTMASVALAVGGNAIFGGALGGTGIVTATEFHGTFIGTGGALTGAGTTWGVNSAGIHTTKNVGIGTTSPEFTQHTYHDTDNVLALFESGDEAALISFQDSNSSTYNGKTPNTQVWLGAQRNDLRLAAGGLERIRVTQDGFVGIGTTNPDYIQHNYHDTANILALFESGDQAALIAFQDNGSTTYNGKTPNNQVWLGAEANDLRLAAGGLERLRINRDGGVNIGGATTTGQLNVTGFSTFNGGIELDSTVVDIHGQVGAARSVLTATGAGVSWGQGGSGVKIDENPPVGNYDADLWWENDTGELHIWYDDGDSQQWVSVSQGPAGVQGAQGVQGAIGVQGHQGVQGAQGHQGVQGAAGAQGAVGAQGAQGHQGAQGAQGHQGRQGATGSGGGVGAQGAQGHQGRQGAQGATGSGGGVGAQGAQGHQGVQGTAGSNGSAGAQGHQGRQGATGTGLNAGNADEILYKNPSNVVDGDSGFTWQDDTSPKRLDVAGRIYNSKECSLATNADTGDLLQIGNDSTTNCKVIAIKRASSKTTIQNIQGVNAGVGPGDFKMQSDGGNVAIGNVTPTEKLHVDGGVRITGAIKDKDNSAGSSGQFLTSTGSQIDWVSSSKYLPRAWAVFSGQTTATLYEDFNVSSVTEVNGSTFDINFSAPWAGGSNADDKNYCAVNSTGVESNHWVSRRRRDYVRVAAGSNHDYKQAVVIFDQ